MEHLIKTNSVFSELTDNSFSPRFQARSQPQNLGGSICTSHSHDS